MIAVPDDSRVQDVVVLAQNLALTRTDPDYYALSLGNALLGGGFYSTRLSIDLRKNAGLVYSVGSLLQAGRTRGAYLIEYACDPQNVSKAADIAVREVKAMQTGPATADELVTDQGEPDSTDPAGGIECRRDCSRPGGAGGLRVAAR